MTFYFATSVFRGDHSNWFPDSPPFMGGLLGPRMVRVSGMAETE